MTAKFTYNDYTVAWLSALPLELTAAVAMLDEIHDHLPRQPNDQNCYTLGKLKGHNVVICPLPCGVYGATAAATAVAHMKRTFPSLEFGLMVGVGGGVPYKLDIRLGDVVVGIPYGNESGVIQYDYGKAESGGKFNRTGCLNKPPPVLLNAVSQIRSSHTLNIKQAIADAQDKENQLNDRFSRPRDDFLFQPAYGHQNSTGDCSKCDLKQLVQREPRKDDNPYIHYGLIGSGNGVIKDPQLRVKFAKDLNIICFEMEAAGIMDELPFLVIRGISDYCDSHKQKQWQFYAALTAAAYAISLLSVVPAVDLPVPRSRIITGTQLDHSYQQIGAYQKIGDDPKEVEACMRGLSATHPIDDVNALKRDRVNRASGTCEWILETDELSSWLALRGENKCNSNILWLHGNPGTGKSTMAMAILDLLSTQPDFVFNGDRTLSYFFCNSNSEDRRTATAILRSLLYQLFKQRPQLMKHIIHRFKERGGKLFTSFDGLWATLIDSGHDSANGQIYFIIDALDECDQESQTILLAQLRETFGDKKVNSSSLNIHFLITSRPYPEIEDRLPPSIRKDLSSDPRSQHDLQTFINEKIAHLSETKLYTENTKQKVSGLLRQKAEGTFLWVGIVCRKLEMVRSRDAVNELEKLPSDLNSMYTHLLETALESARHDKETVLKIFGCVAVSRRQLTVEELAVACKLYETDIEKERFRFTLEDIDLCRLLIVVRNGFVRLLHQSVKDFLFGSHQSGNLFNELQANAALAYRCLDYLLPHMRSAQNTQQEKASHVFLGYAICSWPEHASAARSEFAVLPAHNSFFQLVSDDRERWLEAYHNHVYDGSQIPHTRARFSIFHVAAKWGLPCLVEFAAPDFSARLPFPWIGKYSDTYQVAQYIMSSTNRIRWGNWVNSRDQRGRTPLHWAIMKQHVEVIVALMDRGADANMQDEESKSALHFAAEAGGEKILQIFLKPPKNLELKDGYGGTPLLNAAENRQLDVIHLLVSVGAQVHAINNKHQNALHLVCKSAGRDSKMVERLFDYEISTCACDADNMTPYLYAMVAGQEDLLVAFLKNGVDVNRPIQRLCWTSRMRNGFTYYELDETRQQPAQEDPGIGLTMLHFASLNGMTGMAKFLLCHDGNPNALSDVGDTPLHLAIRSKIKGLQYQDPWVNGMYAVEMLADLITDYESEETSQIYDEIYQARIRVVDVLLESNTIDVNIANNYGDYPLHEIPFRQVYAATILASLLDYGADLSKLNRKQQTCLHLASKEGNLDAVCRLMEEGCDITLLDADGLSPLHYAVRGNHANVVQFMVQHSQETGRAWQQVDYGRKNLLHHHVEQVICSIEMIDALLEYGYNIIDLD